MEFFEKLLNNKIKVIESEVKSHGSSGAIYVPKKYIKKKVIVILKNED